MCFKTWALFGLSGYGAGGVPPYCDTRFVKKALPPPLLIPLPCPPFPPSPAALICPDENSHVIKAFVVKRDADAIWGTPPSYPYKLFEKGGLIEWKWPNSHR